MARHITSILAQFALLAAVAVGSESESLYTVTEEVFFEVKVVDMDGPGKHYTGRFVIGVFGDVTPMTSMNLIEIAKGKHIKGRLLHYKNTLVHRVVQDFVVQMGDVTTGDGSGGESIYGSEFNDENFILSHRAPGMVAMANTGPDTNNSQFYILLSKARWLDGKHVVFGKVIRGMKVIQTLGDVSSDSEAVPSKKIIITDCGVMNLKSKYFLSEQQVDSTEDL